MSDEKKKKKKDKKKDGKKDKKKSVGQYSLGDVIGRGGFGVVYKGLNTENAEFVAVKKVSLKHCSKEQIESIQSEIKLLKKLKHPHIVRYIDHKQTKNKLYIIIEYIENGSLQDLVRDFGKMKEPIVSMYISQVLDGLRYLHSEGVIHRDIKGANILTTKQGMVKLADFGVAAALNDVEAEHAAGTPYWMAPEIIELNPATTASDIWSVGCTVIELLTGEPPYFNLDPMPALYRIVQDEHPPLPQDSSPACKDFMMQCFQKDPNLRKSADKLLNHPWIRRKVDPDRPISTMMGSPDGSLSARSSMVVTQRGSVAPNQMVHRPSLAPTQTAPRASVLPNAMPQQIVQPAVQPAVAVPVPAVKADEGKKEPVKKVDDDDDWAVEEETENKGKPLLELKGVTNQKVEENKRESKNLRKSLSNKSLLLAKFKEEDENADDNWGDDEEKVLVKNTKFDQILLSGDGNKQAEFQDDDDDDLGGMFKSSNADVLQTIDLASKLKQKVTQNDGWDEDEENDDPFQDAVESQFDELETDYKLTQRELELKLQQDVMSLISQLGSQVEDQKIIETCEKLLAILSENISIKNKLTQPQGALTIMEMLTYGNAAVIHAVLKVVNLIIEHNTAFQETLCLVGVLPAVMKFSGSQYSTEVHKQAAEFIHEIIHTSPLTLQMFIACQGFPVLVAFLTHEDEQYQERKDIMFSAVNAILQVFEGAAVRTPKNDFCRLFSSSKIMYHLSRLLLNILKDSADERANSYLNKILTILLLFSQADSRVKEHMAEEIPLSRFLESLNLMQGEHKLNMLRVIKNLASDSITFASFEKVQAMPKIIQQLGEKNDHMVNQALSSLFSLCRVNRERLEMAAVAGITPYLQKIIDANSPLKHMALTLIFDMAHHKKSRQELWKYKGVEFYIKIFNIDNWQDRGLEALAEWMKEKEETKRVQDVLVKPENVNRIVEVFAAVPHRTFAKLIVPLQKLLNISPEMNKALSQNGKFISSLASNMSLKRVDPHILLTELKIVKSLYNYTTKPKQMMVDLYPVLKNLVSSSTAQLIKSTAQDLIDGCDANIQI
jgi:hypothetical protein